jgi:pimeloyl-ACP methyl ester carboxylesterase
MNTMRSSMWFTLFLGMAAILDSQPVVGQERPDLVRDSRFVEAACPVEVGPAGRDEIVCGTVAVPENWEDGSSRRIAISVAVIRAKDSNRSEGFVRLGGGPTPNLPGAAGALQSRLRDTRDVVLFDYRGTGSSEVICPDLGTAYLQTYTQPLTPEDMRASRRAIADECRDWAQQRGIDPGAYNARNMAMDVIAIVGALGYETWTIDAVSFGTAVAQHVMRARPDGLRAVILRGPLALDATGIEEEPFERALRLMAQYCARDAACAAAFPDPLGDYEALYDQLERTPMRLAL